ncbi:MAG TPA: glycosyltransferase family 39 protein, partial [Chloroflexi bacterium]|nr:glycosyltransferase family 39 protein [Chloroflexota bacterium]
MSRYKAILIPIAIFLLALAVRLPGLDVFFTADEFLWVDRSRNFLGGLLSQDFECLLPDETKTNAVPGQGLACTLRTGHPGVLTMWTGAAGITLEWLTRPADDTRSLLQFVQELPTNPVERRTIAPVRLPTVIITALFVLAVYWLLGKLFKPPIPLLAALLIALNPFHVALSRALHHDALSTSFIVTSALSLIIYFGVDRRRRWLILAGALAGVAMLSKSTGLFLIPYAGLLGLWSLLATGARGEEPFTRTLGRTVLDGLLWAGIAALSFSLLWPAMWVIPGQALNTIYSIGFKY